MALKIYSKRGNTNYKEKKLIKKIEEALLKKFANEPDLESRFQPATNPEELQALYDKYCTEEVSFEEIPNKENEHKDFRDGMKESLEEDDEVKTPDTNYDDKDLIEDNEEDNKFVDPFNRDTPIVRDYVMDDGFKDEAKDEPKKTSFDEPQSFGESFQMPGSDIGSEKQDNTNNNKKKDKPKEQPFNPSFDDMNSGRKKRSTKKFAKYIVEGICMLAEKGFVWWTTKNITEEKLAEYELSGEYDFNVLLTLETGQEVYVKQWFKQQRFTAEQLSKFEQEEKDDLSEVLAEVLNEKGFAPTPTQELLIIAAKVIGGKALIAMQMSAGINSVLAQLKVDNQIQRAPQQIYEEPEQPQTQQVQQMRDTKQGSRGEAINTPIVEWDDDLLDESAEAIGNPIIDNQLTTE
jgi:hypothetical protein